jgi:DNA invertase Pin-like site-specific DNA recombinase
MALIGYARVSTDE